MIPYYCTNHELKRGTPGAAGYDIVCDNGIDREVSAHFDSDGCLTLRPGNRFLINTNLFLAIPYGYVGMLCSRSGLSLNHGVVVLNAPGIVDCDYRGEVKITLANLGHRDYVVRPGDRIAQILFTTVQMTMQHYRGHVSHEMRIDGESGEFLHRVDSLEEFARRYGNTERGTSGHGSTGR